MTEELVTIAEAARRLGLPRQRLSSYIHAAGMEKTVADNGRALVNFSQVQQLLATRAQRQASPANDLSDSQPLT